MKKNHGKEDEPAGGTVGRRDKAPREPERQQYIRIWGTRVRISAPVAAMVAGAMVAALIYWYLTVAGIIHP